jgi:hypothetical protein
LRSTVAVSRVQVVSHAMPFQPCPPTTRRIGTKLDDIRSWNLLAYTVPVPVPVSTQSMQQLVKELQYIYCIQMDDVIGSDRIFSVALFVIFSSFGCWHGASVSWAPCMNSFMLCWCLCWGGLCYVGGWLWPNETNKSSTVQYHEGQE